MAYRIVYAKKKRTSRLKWLWVLPVLAIGIRLLGLGGSIWEYFVPGDAGVTAGAFGELMENIHRGEALQECFIAFCREVLDHASYG